MANPSLKARQVAWSNQLEDIGAEYGFFRDLDPEHKALFIEGDDTLVVTFDNLDDARQKVEDRLPWGVRFINAQGWSALGLAAHGWTWYRSDAVLDFFDELRAEGFFDRFRRVVFYGASMAGYAATAFASAAPGATVIALAPQATLDRGVTGGWESRFRGAWSRNFTGRYGFAPDQLSEAQHVWLFYDPLVVPDAAHAALYRGDQITRIRCRHMGHNLGSMLNAMGALKPIVQGCVSGQISSADIYQELRRRRTLPMFQKGLLNKLEAGKRPGLTYRYARAVLNDSHPARRPHFRGTMDRLAGPLNLPRFQPPQST